VPSIGLQTGLRALLTSQRALDVIGHNVSNANTPGYSRQDLLIAATRPIDVGGLRIGSGVNPQVVRRTVDDLLQSRLVRQVSSLHRLDARLGGLSEIEALLAEPSDIGLSAGLSGFFDSISELAASSADPVLRAGMVQGATTLTDRLGELDAGLGTLRRDSEAQVEIGVEQVNALAREIVDLNKEITLAEASGQPASDLRDQRDLRLTELGRLVDVTYNESPAGVVRVSVSGRILVGDARAFEMRATGSLTGGVTLTIGGSSTPLNVTGGKLAGLLGVSQGFIPGFRQDLERFARNLIVEVNRAHSTGAPQQGYFTRLTAEFAVEDQDSDGLRTDELLGAAGLPFDVVAGELYVNTTDLQTGAIATRRLALDPAATSVGELLSELNAIDGLNAGLDHTGRVRIQADAGWGFDFAPRLNASPDAAGTFGGGRASLGTGGAGPFALSDGDTLDLIGPATTFSVTFDAADFVDIASASAQEVAAVLNANAGMQTNGLRAAVVGERVVLQTQDDGAAAGFEVQGGSAAAAFGWSAGTVVAGHDVAVTVAIGGEYGGQTNEEYTFVPLADGVVGTTAGLAVAVYDRAGNQVATLDLGADYLPGTELAVAEGVTVSFGFGELSATHNDVFRVDAIADADTSDVLVAMGINGFFTGTGAADIGVRADIAADPRMIAGSASGAEGDNHTLLALLELQTSDVADLGDSSLGEFYGEMVADVGVEIASADNSRAVGQYLFDNLSTRREQISGVNIDEELVNMIRFEQAFAAASRYLQVVNDLNDQLLSII